MGSIATLGLRLDGTQLKSEARVVRQELEQLQQSGTQTQAVTRNLSTTTTKGAADFRVFGNAVKEAGNELGLGMGRGAIQAGQAISQSVGALRMYTRETIAATAAAGAMTKAQLSLAAAANIAKGALAFFGGPVGLAVIGALVAYDKLTQSWTKSTEKQIEKLNEMMAAADKATQRIRTATEARKELDRQASGAERLAGATRGGTASLDAEMRRLEIAERTRAAFEKMGLSVAHLDDAALKSFPEYERIHGAVVRIVNAQAKQKKALEELAEGARLYADSQEEFANFQDALHQGEVEQIGKIVKHWQDARKELDAYLDAYKKGGLAGLDTSAISGALRPFNVGTPSTNGLVSPEEIEAGRRLRARAEAIDAALINVVNSFDQGGEAIAGAMLQGAADIIAASSEAFAGLGQLAFLIGPAIQALTSDRISTRISNSIRPRVNELLNTPGVERGMSIDEATRIAEQHRLSEALRNHAQTMVDALRRHAESIQSEVTDIQGQVRREGAGGDPDLLRAIDREERLAAAKSDYAKALLSELFALQDVNREREEGLRVARENASIEAEIARLRGDESGALEIERQLRLADVTDESTRALLELLFTLQDEARAAAEAAEEHRALIDALRGIEDLEVDTLRAQGKDREADEQSLQNDYNRRRQAILDNENIDAETRAAWLQALDDWFAAKQAELASRYAPAVPDAPVGEDPTGSTRGPNVLRASSLTSATLGQADRLIGINASQLAVLRQIARHTAPLIRRTVMFDEDQNDNVNTSGYLSGDASVN